MFVGLFFSCQFNFLTINLNVLVEDERLNTTLSVRAHTYLPYHYILEMVAAPDISFLYCIPLNHSIVAEHCC